jgi:hypothetical protein
LHYLLVCAIGFGGAACTSVKQIRPTTEPGRPAFGPVKPGDKVTLHLRDGRRVAVRVDQVYGDGIVSVEGIRYARSDITRIDRRSISAVKTTALVAGLAFGIFVVAGIMIVSALDSLWGM